MEAQCPVCRRTVPEPVRGARACPWCGADWSPAGAVGTDGQVGAARAVRRLLVPASVLALAASFAHAFFARSAETLELEREREELTSALVRVRRELGTTRRSVASREDELREVESQAASAETAIVELSASDTRLSGDVEASMAELRARLAELRTRDAASQRGPGAETEVSIFPKRAVAETQRAERTAPATARPGSTGEPPPGGFGDEMSARLAVCRRAVVTVVSSQEQLATGFVVATNGATRYVLTVSSAAPYGADLACLFRFGDGGGAPEFEAAGATVVYRDERRRLVLLACTPKLARHAAVVELPDGSGSEPAKGDRLYAVCTQVVGTVAFTDNVLEGAASANDRATADLRLLQTTIPANPGSLGAPVLDARGMPVGLVWSGIAGLERTSAVMPVEELASALERMRAEVRRGTGAGTPLYPAPAGGPPAHEAAARSRSLPYESSDATPLARPLGASTEVFAGPDDLVVVWDPADGSIAAYRRGGSIPAWTRRFDSAAGLAMAYEPWRSRAIVSSRRSRAPSVAVDLRTGAVAGTLPVVTGLGGVDLGIARSAWTSFPLGDFELLALDRGVVIAGRRSAKGFSLSLPILMMGHHEDVYTFSTPEGELGWFRRSDVLPLVLQIAAAMDAAERIRNADLGTRSRRDKLQSISKRIAALSNELTKQFRVIEAGAEVQRDSRRPRASFVHVPGSYLHVIGRTLWQVGPDRVARRGRFAAVRHSAGDEAWFHAYYREGAQPCAMVSPNGRHAVTDTHLFDLKELKPLVELPFPAGPIGFTSSGSLVYAHDRLRRSVVFLEVDRLLESAPGPYGEKAGVSRR